MPFEMRFLAPTGAEHKKSYWVASTFNIDLPNRTIAIVFIAYNDKSAWEEGKTGLLGGTHYYGISGPDFDAFMAATPIGGSFGEVIANAAEDYALATNDTPSGQVDGEGNPIMVSFFADAKQD